MPFGSKDDPILAQAHAVFEAFETEKNAHLAKLSGEKGVVTLEKWLVHYFDRQDSYHDLEEFRFHLESVVEEYCGYYASSLANKVDLEALKRMDSIGRQYHAMIYDGEIDPYQEESDRKQAEAVKSVGALGRISRLLGWSS
ncbi:MAG: hypothetical protein WA194_04720 [Patescibacteria group bacterium]